MTRASSPGYGWVIVGAGALMTCVGMGSMFSLAMVMAVEMPVRDQPVSTEIGCRNTASENIAPMLTQVISAPAATITQP